MNVFADVAYKASTGIVYTLYSATYYMMFENIIARRINTLLLIADHYLKFTFIWIQKIFQMKWKG